ncbi:MAG: hypothetical protein R2747_13740 [Pyrinomonadaceae bacterium]
MKRLFWAIIAGLAFFSVGVPAQSETFFQTVGGKWQGTLEYLDYTSNERVTLKMQVEIKPAADGESAEFFTIFDDFGKMIKNSETERIDRTESKFYQGDASFKIESITDGKIVLLGSAPDGETVERVRKTITYSKDRLVILKETRDPWRFRNRIILQREPEENGSGEKSRPL